MATAQNRICHLGALKRASERRDGEQGVARQRCELDLARLERKIEQGNIPGIFVFVTAVRIAVIVPISMGIATGIIVTMIGVMAMTMTMAVAVIVSRRRLRPADETLVADMDMQPAELKRQQAKTGGNSDWPLQTAHWLSIQLRFVTPRLGTAAWVAPLGA